MIPGTLAMTEMLPPYALRVAATLRLSDLLADGPLEPGELARRAGAHEAALERLLRYLTCLGWFRRLPDGRYAATAAGRFLGGEHPAGARAWLDLDTAAGRMDMALAGLLHAVRTGEPGYESVFGRSFWSDLAARPELGTSFDDLMRAKSRPVSRDLAALDWSGVRLLADIGGGVGSVLATILAAHPHLTGLLLDRPEPAGQAAGAFAALGLAERCRTMAADFRTAQFPAADAYLFFDILHNWGDSEASDLLRRCGAAGGAGARILVVENLPDGPDDQRGLAMDLKMLTLFGGRQRTADELRALALGADLRTVSAQRLTSGFTVVTLTVPGRPGDVVREAPAAVVRSS